MNRKILAGFATLTMAVTFLGGISVQAANFNWIGSADNNYTNPLAWDQSAVPGLYDTAIIGNGTTANAIVLYTNALSNPLSTNNLSYLEMGTATGTSTFTMSDGMLLITNGSVNPYTNGSTAFALGNVSGANDTFIQNGGTLVVARPSNLVSGQPEYYQDGFYPGHINGATGTYTINGGLLEILCGCEIAASGSGAFAVNGGTVIANGWFGLRGGGTSTDSGVFNMTGGTLYILRNNGNEGGSGTYNGLAFSQNGYSSTANISGGTLYCEKIHFGNTSTANETLNISGGNFYIGFLGVEWQGAAASQVINISGGTFHTVNMLIIPTQDPTIGDTNSLLANGTNWTWDVHLPVNLTNSPGSGTVTFAPEAGRTITLNNAWSGVGGLTVNGPGTVVLNGTNTYTGGTTISQGTLAFNNGGAVVDSTLTVASGATLDFNAGNVTINFTNSIAGAGNLLVSLGSSGTEITTGNLGYSGSTLVRSGTLEVDGALNNSSGVVVSNGATLGGSGQISAPISVNANATLYTGTAAAPGTLTVGNVTVSDNGALRLRIGHDLTPGGGTNDLLQTHNLTLAPNSVLNISTLNTLSIGTYVLAQCSGTLTGTFGTVNGPQGASVAYTGNEVDLVVTSTNVANLTWNALIGATNILWDVSTSSNWFNTGTAAIDEFHQSDAVVFDSTPGTTNRVSIAATVNPSSITMSGGYSYIVTGVGKISGNTSLTMNGTGTNGIYIASGNNFTGPVYINSGVLMMGTGGVSGLGMGTNSNIYATNNGTLDLNDISPGSKTIVIAGSGWQGMGALADSSTNTAIHYCVTNVVLAGPATIGANGRWDFPSSGVADNGGTLTGNGFDLTKVGLGTAIISPSGGVGLGNIDIQAGTLLFGPHVTDLGATDKTITVESNASLYFYGTPALANKTLLLNNAATVLSGLTSPESAPQFIGPVTLVGTNTINTLLADLTLSNVVSGAGGFVKSGPSNLWLTAANTYSGSTLISAGGIVLGANGSISNSSLIQLAATNTFLNASAASGLTLTSGQTLSGSGVVVGDVTAGTGSMIAPGTVTAASTLTFSNNLTLNGGTNVIKLSNDPSTIGGGVNDLISVASNLTFSSSSTIEITPIGILDTNSPYTVVRYNAGTPPTAANIHLICDNPGYTVSLVDPTTTSGSIEVNITGSPANLLWQGTAASNPNIWDHTTTNWLNLDTTNPTVYHPGDNVSFDDSASTKTVNVTVTAIGSMTMSNTAAYTFTGGGLLGGSLDMEGTGATTLTVSNPPAFSTITANYGMLTFDVYGVNTYSNNATISDNNGGQATLVKAGTNTLVLGANNAQFYGTIIVDNGILQYTSSASLGAPQGYLYATNNGTLDLHGVSSGPKNINIQGTGFNGQGALINTGGSLVNQAGIYYLNITGDATIGGTGRFDIYNNTINGNGFNVTKIGVSALFFTGSLETYLGNLDIQGGRIGFQADITMGDPSKTVTIETNGAVTFYGLTNSSSYNGGEDKIAVMHGGNSDPTNGYAVMDSGGGNNNFNGPVTLVGTNNIFGVRSDLHLWNGVSGSGGLIASGSYYAGADFFSGGGTLYLEGTNTYTGPTIISNNIVVGPNSSLGNSSLIEVGGAKLDVSAPTSFNLGAGQTLIGTGTVTGGNIVFGSGATLAEGFPNTSTYTLTMNGNLTLQPGSTNIVVVKNGANDTVAGLTSVQMGGTLVVTNVGNPLAGGNAIKLFSATSYSGSFANIIPATPGPGMTWDTSQLDNNGTLLVQGPAVNPNPTNIVFSVAGNQLTLSWPSDHTGWTLQVQTNTLSVGISTNWVNVPSSTTTNKIIMPIDSANGAVFYRMILTNP